jgi:anaerobic magnesium-protoporphyrin IX monomethyl ester cyclase
MAVPKFKVVLAVPEFSGPRAGSENLGISYIEASLRADERIECATINRNCTLSTTQIAEKIRAAEPDLVGVSLTTYELVRSLQPLLAELSELTCPIVAGGHYASFIAKSILDRFEKISACIVGEGEDAIVEVINSLRNNTALGEVRGIAHRNGQQVEFTPPREKIADLDHLPLPIRDSGLLVYSVAGSRGCYTTCSFCSVPQFFKMLPGRNFRLRSAQNIGMEIAALKTLGAKAISFVDDVFLIPGQRGLSRAKEIADVMSSNNIKWAFGCRTPELTEEIVAYCAPRGLCNVGLGLESGSDKALQRLSKRANLAASENAISLCRKYGVSIQPYFIMFEPDMSLQDLKVNIDFLSRHGLLWPSFASNELDPYPGTPAYHDLQKAGRLQETNGRMIPKYLNEEIGPLKETIKTTLRPLMDDEYALRRRQFQAELSGDQTEKALTESALWQLSDRTRAQMTSCMG